MAEKAEATPDAMQGARMYAEQVRLIAAYMIQSSMVAVVGTLLIVYIGYTSPEEDVNRSFMLGWAVYQALVIVIRNALVIAYNRNQPEVGAASRWGLLFTAATLATALGWGSLPFLFDLSEQGFLREVIVIATAFFATGSMSYLSVIWPLYITYLLLTMAPLTIVLLVGDNDLARAIGVSLIAMAVFLFLMSKRYHQTLIDSLALSFENEALAAASYSNAEAFRSLFDAAPVSLMLVRRSDGEVIRANSRAYTMVEAVGGNPGGSGVIASLFSSRDWHSLARKIMNPGEQAQEDISLWDATVANEHYIVSSTSADINGEASAILGFQNVSDLKRYETELVEAKDKAERALSDLRIAQSELIRSEKLAALGSLVAGVAHEINTPLGNTLTAATHLADEGKRLQEAINAGQLKRSSLETFLKMQDETTGLMLSNMERAVTLVQSFKQVAVDQTSEDRRTFDLKEYLDEVILSMRPRLKKTAHTVSVACPEDLIVDGYPGALFQVVTNLVMNALIHAFEPDTQGEISIEISAPGDDSDWIILAFRDNGLGMPDDVRSRIFDPFFTTKRGAGGSGLGMHIVYNFVTVTMGGHIEVRSEPGKGTLFLISFPSVMPMRSGNAVGQAHE